MQLPEAVREIAHLLSVAAGALDDLVDAHRPGSSGALHDLMGEMKGIATRLDQMSGEMDRLSE